MFVKCAPRKKTRCDGVGRDLQAWIGYSQSLRPCENGLTLNVDMVCTAFLQELPVPKFLAEAAGFTDFGQFIQAASAPNGRGEAAVRKARKAITGLKVHCPL